MSNRRKASPERLIAIQAWQAAHPEKVRQSQEKSRAKRRQRRAEDPEYAETLNARVRMRRKTDPEYAARQNETDRKWRAAHPDKVRMQRRVHYLANRTTILAKRAQQHQEHSEAAEAANARTRAWRVANPEKHLAAVTAWQRAHPAEVRAIQQACRARRRARLMGALINDFTAAQWQEMQAMYGYRCVYCPLDCQACKKKSHRLTMDHIIALAKEGNHTASNILPACRSCNSKKGIKSPTVPVQPVLLMQAPPKKGRSLVAGMDKVEEGADGWIRITLPEGLLIKLSRFEFALALKRGKDEQRALRHAVREQQQLSQAEADVLAWMDA